MLTVNDPVSLDSMPAADQGQASGVSATAEQAGGAIGIAAIYALFHTAYVERLTRSWTARRCPTPPDPYEALRSALQAAEETGLRPAHFDPALVNYLFPAESAAEHGYAVAFLAVTAIALAGLVASALLVRKPAG